MSEIYRGSVFDTEDPQDRGRLRLLIPAALGDAISPWAEPMVPPSPTYKPDIGAVMWVFFENGDLTKPVYSSTAEITAAMLEAFLILTNHLIVGDPLGQRFEMNPTQVIATDVNDQVVFNLSPGDNMRFQFLDSLGNITAAINDTGDAAFNGLDISGTATIPGDNLVIDGQTFTDISSGYPRGTQVYGSRQPVVTGIQDEFGLMEVDWNAPPDINGRLMLLHTSIRVQTSNTDPVTWSMRIRYTIDGSTPDRTSTLLRRYTFTTAGNSEQDYTVTDLWNPGPVDIFKFIITVEVVDGDPTHRIVSIPDNVLFIVEDSGDADIANVAKVNTGGGTGSDSGGNPPNQRPQTITRLFNSVRAGTYDGGGGLINTGHDLTQGYYTSTNGNQKAAIWFPTAAIQSALNNYVNIISVELFLYANHWYYYGGGTAVIGFHGDSAGSVPSNWSAISGKFTDVERDSFPRPGGKWVDITSHTPTGWANGDKAGILLGPAPSTDHLFYGAFNGPTQANIPKLRIKYRK